MKRSNKALTASHTIPYILLNVSKLNVHFKFKMKVKRKVRGK